MKKIIFALMASALLLAGCGDSAGSVSDKVATEVPEGTTVTFWHGMNGTQEEVLTKLTNDFNVSQTNITVELVNQGDYGTLQSKLTSAGNSNTLPTMSQAYSNWLYEYNKECWLVDLKPYFEDATIGTDSSVYVDAFINEVSTEDSIYAIPFNKSTELLFINDELMGDNPVPTTPAEVVEVSKAIYEETGKPGFAYDSLSNYFALSSALCGNSEWVVNGAIDFNNECMEEAISTYQDGINEGWARVAGEDKYLSGPFGNGDIGMFIGSTAGASFVDSAVDGKFTYSIVSYPAEIAPQQGTSLAVYSTATPEERTAAYEYIKFMTSEENTIYWALNTGYLPVVKTAYDNQTYLDGIANDLVSKVAKENIDKLSVIVPVFGGSNEIYNVNVNDFMSATLESLNDVQTELADLQADAQIIYDDNN